MWALSYSSSVLIIPPSPGRPTVRTGTVTSLDVRPSCVIKVIEQAPKDVHLCDEGNQYFHDLPDKPH